MDTVALGRHGELNVRVMTLTRDTNLAMALSFSGDDGREILTIGSAEELRRHEADEFDVALIDLRSAEDGLAVASAIVGRQAARCVVIADEPPVSVKPGVTILLRPFTLDEIEALLDGHRVERALTADDLPRTAEPEDEFQEREDEATIDVPDRYGSGSSLEGVRPLDPSPQTLVKPLVLARHAEEARVGGYLAEILEATLAVDRALRDRPRLLSLPAVSERLLEEAEVNIGFQSASVWTRTGIGNQRLTAARGSLRLDAPGELARELPLVEALAETVDALLLTSLNQPQPLLEGLPELEGQAMIAAALRYERSLEGIVILVGTAYVPDERDLLAGLASSTAVELITARTVDRIRSYSRAAVDPQPARASEGAYQ